MKFWGIILGILGILGLSGFIFLSNLHNGDSLSASQKEKALTQLLGRKPIATPTDHSKWLTYKSTSMTFLYPSWATIYTKDNEIAKKDSNVLDSFHFSLPDMHISGSVSVLNRLAFSNIDEEPGVELRLQNSDYMSVGSTSAEKDFVNQINMERSLFILKNGKVFTLVITGGGDGDNKDIFEKIKSSLNF